VLVVVFVVFSFGFVDNSKIGFPAGLKMASKFKRQTPTIELAGVFGDRSWKSESPKTFFDRLFGFSFKI